MFPLYGLENRLQEASVFLESFLIVLGNRCLYSSRRGGCHDFKSADKDPHDLSWCRIDSERQDVVDEPAGHDVDQATALFEPGVLPSLNHGVGFVPIYTLADENLFQIAVERIYASGQHRR